MKEAVIVSAARTPLGSFGGSLSSIGATDLGGMVIKEAVRRAGIEGGDVDECVMGMVLPCGYGQNPGKQAVIKADLPQAVSGLTVNKVCGSGLKAVMLAAQAIRCGDAEVVVAGGMENMSRAPYYMEKARWGMRMGPGKIEDHMVHDGLWDVVNDFHMGMSNELISEKWGITREDQDRLAAESYRRALLAIENGRFVDEIMPVPVAAKKGETRMFSVDECAKPTSYEALAKMKPAFKKDGVGTAGNASSISDGAAALVLMEKKKALAMGCRIMAEIGAQASAGIELRHVLMAPAMAIPKALEKQGITTKDVDLFEINEAFAGSSFGVNKVLELDIEKVCVNGGGIALGHPIGASGARVLITLLYEMQRRDAKTGVASLCLGGGEAVAIVVQR
ncbi:MAG: acetyl-CoA C-acetyltransferase [Desulfobulbaceae bacterium]|jgi:acetyl-CoA C-acetyltransferase|nr:acetyl-CoA C-acetyltransferase [Desulfobulbaceae bacterium]